MVFQSIRTVIFLFLAVLLSRPVMGQQYNDIVVCNEGDVDVWVALFQRGGWWTHTVDAWHLVKANKSLLSNCTTIFYQVSADRKHQLAFAKYDSENNFGALNLGPSRNGSTFYYNSDIGFCVGMDRIKNRRGSFEELRSCQGDEVLIPFPYGIRNTRAFGDESWKFGTIKVKIRPSKADPIHTYIIKKKPKKNNSPRPPQPTNGQNNSTSSQGAEVKPLKNVTCVSNTTDKQISYSYSWDGGNSWERHISKPGEKRRFLFNVGRQLHFLVHTPSNVDKPNGGKMVLDSKPNRIHECQYGKNYELFIEQQRYNMIREEIITYFGLRSQ